MTKARNTVVVLDESFVFRFPRTAAYVSRAIGERRLLHALSATTPVPIPAYQHVSEAGDFAGNYGDSALCLLANALRQKWPERFSWGMNTAGVAAVHRSRAK